MPSPRVRKTRCPQCRTSFTPTQAGDPTEVCELCDAQLALPFPPVRDSRGRFRPALRVIQGGAR